MDPRRGPLREYAKSAIQCRLIASAAAGASPVAATRFADTVDAASAATIAARRVGSLFSWVALAILSLPLMAGVSPGAGLRPHPRRGAYSGACRKPSGRASAAAAEGDRPTRTAPRKSAKKPAKESEREQNEFAPRNGMDSKIRVGTATYFRGDPRMAPSRPFWKGYLKLSLVSCPIAMFPASSSSERVSFRQINKSTGNRLKQQLVDSVTGDVVEPGQKGRGYEIGRNQFMPVVSRPIRARARPVRTRPRSFRTNTRARAREGAEGLTAEERANGWDPALLAAYRRERARAAGSIVGASELVGGLVVTEFRRPRPRGPVLEGSGMSSKHYSPHGRWRGNR
jgi:hypothetical protein